MPFYLECRLRLEYEFARLKAILGSIGLNIELIGDAWRIHGSCGAQMKRTISSN